jgi:hypothetical protein
MLSFPPYFYRSFSHFPKNKKSMKFETPHMGA